MATWNDAIWGNGSQAKVDGKKTPALPKTASIESAYQDRPTTNIVSAMNTSHNLNREYLLVGGVNPSVGIVDSVTSNIITSVVPVSNTLLGTSYLHPNVIGKNTAVPGAQS